MKACTACKESKEAESFYKAPISSDGLMGICKECHKKRVRLNRKKKVEYYRKYDRWRFNNDPRVRERNERYSKSKRGQFVGKRCKKRWIERNKAKRRCHIITGNAIRDGVLVKQPCEVCGKTNVHAHHDDYSKPLQVRWLCPKHHKQWHDENGEGITGE